MIRNQYIIVMICRRRINKNPALLCLVLAVGAVVTYLKFSSSYHSQYTMNSTTTDIEYQIQTISPNSDLANKLSLEEVDRLSSFENKEKHLKSENDEMMKKYNESLQLNQENEDPFNKKHIDTYIDFVNFDPTFKDTVYIAKQLKPVIDDLNKQQLLYNRDKFPNLPVDHAIIVIQVHKRVEYFKELLDSLQRSKGIENVILVISHDYYSDIMNALIRKIKFCQVIQIFFPYSEQLYPKEFPGQSAKDCPRDMMKADAINSGCINAEHPDMYGHYRESHITMTKHHWWWKINMVFDVLPATNNNNGPVMFIEEDHYVSPSFYDALMKLHHLKQIDPACKESCEILTLGTYNNKQDFEKLGRKVSLGTWLSTQHNMGMAMYRSTWNKIRKCAKEFCTFDDYNWDWTLMFLSKSCIGKLLKVLVYEVPRVFHIGDCGLHHTKSCTNSKDTINKVKGIIDRQRNFLYTDKLSLVMQSQAAPSQKANGGWADVRDHELCLKFVKVDENIMKR